MFKFITNVTGLLALSIASLAHAAPSVEAPGETWHLAALELSFLNATQGSGNTSSALIAWTPRYRIDAQFAVRANLGFSALLGKNSHGHDMKFAVLDAEVLLRMYLLEHFDIELGGGVQDWDNQGGVQGAVSFNVGYHFSPMLVSFVDRVFIGYTNVFLDPNVNEVRAGLGASF